MSVAACGISSTQDTDVALLIRATGQNIWPDGQITKNLSSPSEENIPLRRHPKSPLQLAPSRPEKRGVGHRHERWGGTRWTRQGGLWSVSEHSVQTTGEAAYGKAVWSWHPLLVSS
jgi:hypothetical protein